jgi:hypothetical protein
LPFAAERRLPDFNFFMRAMLKELLFQVHAPDRRAATSRKNGFTCSGLKLALYHFLRRLNSCRILLIGLCESY